MNIETVPIASLAFDPANVRAHNQKNIDAIKGSLARFGHDTERFFDRIRENDLGCWEFIDIQPHTGYGKFHANKITWRSHRWIMFALNKISYKEKICVLHRCDNRPCVNPEHLYLGDRYQNAQDIKARNRTHLISEPKLGSKNPSSKLNETIVIEIRKQLQEGKGGKYIAEKYNVSETTISEIKSRKIWRHV